MLKYLVRQINAGTQCVAMSLSALVYNLRNPITCSADLVQIMTMGNDMYSALSQSYKQGLLLLTDLPVMVNLSYINYKLTYSESYSGLYLTKCCFVLKFELKTRGLVYNAFHLSVVPCLLFMLGTLNIRISPFDVGFSPCR